MRYDLIISHQFQQDISNHIFIQFQQFYLCKCINKQSCQNKMSGGFEYNMTTQSEYEEMKQRNNELFQQNITLKQSLEELIKINTELTDSMEQFNNANVKNAGKDPQLEHKIQQLLSEIDYYKSLIYTNQDKGQIIAALEGLIQSFNQTQKLYEEEISNICEQLDQYKNEWETKLENCEQMYMHKMKNVDELITQLRMKEEIVAIIEKKMNQSAISKGQRVNSWNHANPNNQNGVNHNQNRVKKKFSEYDENKLAEQYQKLDNIETVSEKKSPGHPTATDSENQYKANQNPSNNNALKQSQIIAYQQQIEQLKSVQSKLLKQINDKNRMTKVYLEMVGKLKKKLMEKF